MELSGEIVKVKKLTFVRAWLATERVSRPGHCYARLHLHPLNPHHFRRRPFSRKNIASRQQSSQLNTRTCGRSPNFSITVTSESGRPQSRHAGTVDISTALHLPSRGKIINAESMGRSPSLPHASQNAITTLNLRCSAFVTFVLRRVAAMSGYPQSDRW
jgi:hypothetical protein